MAGSAVSTAPSAAAGQTGRTVDIKAFIDAQRITAYQWLLVAICFLIVVADGMDVAIMGFVTPSILTEWNISRPAFGIVISAAPFGLVVGALVAGASSATEMAILRFLAGTGMGAAMPNASTLLSEYAPQRRRSLMITIMFTGF